MQEEAASVAGLLRTVSHRQAAVEHEVGREGEGVLEHDPQLLPNLHRQRGAQQAGAGGRGDLRGMRERAGVGRGMSGRARRVSRLRAPCISRSASNHPPSQRSR